MSTVEPQARAKLRSLPVLLCGILLLPGIARASRATEQDALRMISAAQARWRELPGYEAESRRIDRGMTIETKQFVRREADGFSLVRVERTASRGGRPGPKLIMLQNREGSWQIEKRTARRLGQLPPVERRLPSQLPTAKVLRLDSAVEYSIETGIEWFGRPCTRIRAMLPAQGIADVRARVESPDRGRGSPDVRLPPGFGPNRRTAVALPVAYVYLIDQATGTIASWQSIGYTGEVVAQINYHGFEIKEDLPDGLFAVPAAYKIVEPEDAGQKQSKGNRQTADRGGDPSDGQAERTKRAYHFAGHKRLTWPFDTPNQLGLAGAVAFVLALGAASGASRRHDGARQERGNAVVQAVIAGPNFPLRGAALLLAMAAVAVMGLTYSRGALVGALAGSAVLLMCRWDARKWILAGMAFFAAVCALLPAGAERAASIAHSWDEASIANRFVVWKGALAMLWDHPVRGVGFDNFREVYATWYQPAHMQGVHLTALNDLLTIGAGAGIPALWTACILLVLVAALGIYALRLRPSGWLAGLVGAWIAYAVASQFSSFITKWQTAWIPLALAAGIVGTRVWLALVPAGAARKSANDGRNPISETAAAGTPRMPCTRRPLLIALFGGTALALALVALAGLASRSFPPRPPGLPAANSKSAPASLKIEPSSRDARGWALVVTDDWAPEHDARRLFRGLAAEGFHIEAWRPDNLGFAGVAELRQKLHEAAARRTSDPILLIGIGAAGRIALAAAAGSETSPTAVVTLGTPSWFALSELSPTESVRRLKSPVLVLHEAGDPVVADTEARQLSESVERAGGIAGLSILSRTSTGTDAPIVDAIMRFLRKQHDRLGPQSGSAE